MNKYLLSLCIIVLLNYGCKKEPKFPDYIGEVHAQINGNDWTGYMAYGYEKNGDTAVSLYADYFKKISNQYIGVQPLFFKNLLLSKNLYQRIYIDSLLSSRNQKNVYSSFYTSQDDGDVFCDAFYVYSQDSLNNWIQITDEVNNYGEIWGNFSCTYLRSSGCAASPYPDTLGFRNGTFHVKLK